MTSEKVKALAREAHGNIYPNSDAYTFERGYIHGYEDALDKACEWIMKNNINYTTMDGEVIPAYDVVQGVRKALEDNS